MPSETGTPANSCWTLMLADVVALMLAFFVLSFSMREMVEADRRPGSAQPVAGAALVVETVSADGDATDPGQGVPLALAPHEGHTTDQLQAPERDAADAPSLAYLAAIIQGDGREPSPLRVRHDATMLMIELPDLPDDGSGQLADAALRPILTLAFLARRFDLDLAVALPAGTDHGLAEQVAQAMRLRDWIADATGSATAPEVTFAAAAPAVGSTDASSHAWAALLVKVAGGVAAGQTPP